MAATHLQSILVNLRIYIFYLNILFVNCIKEAQIYLIEIC